VQALKCFCLKIIADRQHPYQTSTMSLKFRTILDILFLGGEQYGREEAISGLAAFERSEAAAGAGS
jgi:hypothetical protein